MKNKMENSDNFVTENAGMLEIDACGNCIYCIKPSRWERIRIVWCHESGTTIPGSYKCKQHRIPAIVNIITGERHGGNEFKRCEDVRNYDESHKHICKNFCKSGTTRIL